MQSATNTNATKATESNARKARNPVEKQPDSDISHGTSSMENHIPMRIDPKLAIWSNFAW